MFAEFAFLKNSFFFFCNSVCIWKELFLQIIMSQPIQMESTKMEIVCLLHFGDLGQVIFLAPKFLNVCVCVCMFWFIYLLGQMFL